MDHEKLLHARRLSLEQASGFIEAAEWLETGAYSHIVYHLSLLALEEVGKASMLCAQLVNSSGRDATWLDRWLDSHRKKLQWAVWSPMTRIDPADFEAARRFAERAHSLRLASLYVDSKADLTDLPPPEQVRLEDAQEVLALAKARLAYEREREIPSGELDDLAKWFLDTIDDPDLSRLVFSGRFIAQYQALDGDARAWAAWVREEVDRLDRENREVLEAELAKPGAPKGEAKARWRANMTVHTPSHSLRSKVLSRWNEKIDSVQLVWSGKKDQFTLQVLLRDNEPLPSVGGRFASLAKLVVACLNIGSIGYFWFERPGFEQQMFKDVRDLELDRPMALGGVESFWGDRRAVALTEEHIDHAIRCMMAFAPLSDAEAEPIFRPYLDGLALIAKSDIFYNFDLLARRAFGASLAAALKKYGGWSGKREDFESSFHDGFAPFMPDREHRNQMFDLLRGKPGETLAAGLRSAKQLADLYLIHASRLTWRAAMDVDQG